MTAKRPNPPRDPAHAISRAAGGGPGQTAEDGVDWLGGRAHDSAADHAGPEAGTPLDLDRPAASVGASRESRRGKHRGG